MSSPTAKQGHEMPSRQVLRFSTTREPYRLLLVVSLVVVCFLPIFRRSYDPLAATGLASCDEYDLDIQTVDTYNEDQLQEVAALMDEIYTLLASTSFIPHNSIKRGPHQINTTASPCKRDAADLRLMEILPYVDRTLLGDFAWLWGGVFADYRMEGASRLEHGTLASGCRPSCADDPSYVMTPGMVHLTLGGDDDWDLYRSWNLQYDTRKHAMRIYEGEEWWPYYDCYHNPIQNDYYRPGWGWNDNAIFEGSNLTGNFSVNRHSRRWTEWADAPTFLRWIRDAYLSAAWSPWETSNRNGNWGIQPSDYISTLLLRNGWPHNFDVNQFRSDFIRAQHKPSGQGWAEGAFRQVKYYEEDPNDQYNIHFRRKKLRNYQRELEGLETRNLTYKAPLWDAMLREGATRREIDRQESDFEDAKRLIQRLCPNNVCVEEEDLILWEFRELEKTYAKAQLEPNATTTCERRNLQPDQLSKCISQLNLEQYWLRSAYQQSRAEAYIHCTRNSKHLLSPASFETLANLQITEYKLNIAEYDHVPAQLNAWQERTGASNSTMEFLREEYREAKDWDTKLNERRIEEIKRALTGTDGDEALLKLWNDLEFPHVPRSIDYLKDKTFY